MANGFNIDLEGFFQTREEELVGPSPELDLSIQEANLIQRKAEREQERTSGDTLLEQDRLIQANQLRRDQLEVELAGELAGRSGFGKFVDTAQKGSVVSALDNMFTTSREKRIKQIQAELALTDKRIERAESRFDRIRQIESTRSTIASQEQSIKASQAEIADKVADNKREINKRSRVNVDVLQQDGTFKTEGLLQGFDEDGKTAFFDTEGRRKRVPEGSKFSTTGRTAQDNPNIEGGRQPLTKTNLNKAQETIINQNANIQQLGGIGRKFAEDYLTYFGSFKSGVGRQLDKLGVVGDFLDRAQQSGFGGESLQGFNARRKQFSQSVDQFFNSYRKEITGAAAAFAELEQLRQTIISTDLGPEEFKASLELMLEKAANMLALHQENVRLGLVIDSRPFQDKGNEAWEALSANDRDLALRRLKAGAGTAEQFKSFYGFTPTF